MEDTTKLVAEGGRYNFLYHLAKRLKECGTCSFEIKKVIFETNRESCQPPLPQKEVESIIKECYLR